MKTRFKLAIIIAAVLLMTALSLSFGLGVTAWAEENAEEGAVVRRNEKKISAQVGMVMYHNISKNSRLQGRFTISPAEFESDLIYLKENGFNTVVMQDLIEFVYDKKPLPQKPVVLTFDDGEFGVYYYAYPLLQKYGMRGVFSIIGDVTDQYTVDSRKDIVFPHITWRQVNEMQDSGCCEFANHSYGLHSDNRHCVGVAMKPRETADEYKRRLQADICLLQGRMKEMTGKKPAVFTYPYGKITAVSEELLHELGFRASISCLQGINTLTYSNRECLFKLRRYNRPHKAQSSRVFGRFER